MIEARWARKEELGEIVEFIDYVFSKAHRPHDFASLLPKVYGDQADSAAHHFILREDGKLAAAVLCEPMIMHMGDEVLTVLGVGSVSTHPAARGKGYLKRLMDAVDERAQEIGADFAVLSGLRQRYEHFGYMYGGYQMNAKLTAHNAFHALKETDADGLSIQPMTQEHVKRAMCLLQKQPCFFKRREEAYLDIQRSWNNEPFVLMKGSEAVGFGTLRRNAESTHIAELLLEDEADFAPAMKALFAQYGTLTICAAPWETKRAAWLSKICQDFSIAKNHAYKIYSSEHVQSACASLGFEQRGFEFEGFSLPLPLYIAPPDCV